jgi:excinuclease ABC subunit C
MVEKADNLEIIEVASELEALLLESRLIKKFKPFYNLISKDDKSPYYLHITKESYPRPIINHISKNAIAGPFLNRYIPTKILRQFRKVAPFCVAPRPVKRPCLYSHLGLCNPCPGSINSETEIKKYLQNIAFLKKLLKGQFSSVKKELITDMQVASKLQNYEQAAIVRNQIQALDYLLFTPIAPEEYISNPNLSQDIRQSALDSITQVTKIYPLHRIEMFDNAHLSGTNATSAMTVAVDGELLPRLYRHFTIKNADPKSDVDMMSEVLSRRIKNIDWPKPDLIILDGGKPQLSAILPMPFPVISLAKRNETIIIPENGSFKEINLSKSNPGLQLIQRLRDEAHRFSRRLHHKHRAKIA